MSHYPQRPGEPDCRDFLRTGRCKYGDSCKYHHPIGGLKAPTDPNEPPFPIRPDEPPCQYYLKNGSCKFGQTCKFHHPPHILSRTRSSSMAGVILNQNVSNDSHGPAIDGNLMDDICLLLPQRPSEPDCIYFLKHARCKYGSTCKYHHPANVHRILSDPNSARYSSQNVYQLTTGRERSMSVSSVNEGRDILGKVNISSQSNLFSPTQYDQPRRIVDSVPPPSRNDLLETISSSFHLYPSQSIDVQLQQQLPPRYYTQGATSLTPAVSGSVSPKLSSPSATSSTIASSYDTAVSGLEKLPPALLQSHVMGIPRSMSGNLLPKNDSMDEFSPQNSIQSSSLDTARISNMHIYMQQGRNLYHSKGLTEEAHEVGSRYSSESSACIHSTSSLTMNNITNRTCGSTNKNVPILNEDKFEERPTRNVDDGLSMMTSALLTMIDTPSDQQERKKQIFEAPNLGKGSGSTKENCNRLQMGKNLFNKSSQGSFTSFGLPELGSTSTMMQPSFLQGLESSMIKQNSNKNNLSNGSLTFLEYIRSPDQQLIPRNDVKIIGSNTNIKNMSKVDVSEQEEHHQNKTHGRLSDFKMDPKDGAYPLPPLPIVQKLMEGNKSELHMSNSNHENMGNSAPTQFYLSP